MAPIIGAYAPIKQLIKMALDRLFRLKQRSTLANRLISGGAWALGAKIGTLILGLMIGGLLARMLSKSKMGDYIFAQSLVVSAALLAQLGLGPTAVKLIARFYAANDLHAVKKSVFHIMRWGVTSAALAAFLFALLGKNLGVSQNIVALTAIWVIILTIQKLLAEILRGFHDIRAAAIVGGASLGGLITYITTAGILLVIWWQLGAIELNVVFALIVISGILSLIWGSIHLYKILRSLKPSTIVSNNIRARQILWMSFPILIDSIVLLLLSQSGIWVLRAFRPSPEIAIYGTALRLATLTAVPLNVINAVTASTIAELFQKGQTKKLEFILRGLATLAALPALIILLIFIIAGANILGLIYGDFYRIGAPVLIILTTGSVMSVAAGSCGQSLMMSGHQKALMIVSVISGLLTLTIELLVVQQYGVIGVAIAMSVGILVKNSLMLVTNKHLTGIWTLLTFRWKQYIPLITKS